MFFHDLVYILMHNLMGTDTVEGQFSNWCTSADHSVDLSGTGADPDRSSSSASFYSSQLNSPGHRKGAQVPQKGTSPTRLSARHWKVGICEECFPIKLYEIKCMNYSLNFFKKGPSCFLKCQLSTIQIMASCRRLDTLVAKTLSHIMSRWFNLKSLWNINTINSRTL